MVVATGGGGDDDGIAANEKLAIMKFFLGEQLSAMAMTAATAEAVMEATGLLFPFKSTAATHHFRNGNTRESGKTSIIN